MSFQSKLPALEGKEKQEGHHQTEKAHSFGKGETQNGVREKLLLQRWVSRVTDDERAEDGSNTSTRSGDANCSGSSADILGRGIDIQRSGGGLKGSGRRAEWCVQTGVAGEQSRSRGSRGDRLKVWAGSLRSNRRRRGRMTGQRRPGDGDDKISRAGEHDCLLNVCEGNTWTYWALPKFKF